MTLPLLKVEDVFRKLSGPLPYDEAFITAIARDLVRMRRVPTPVLEKEVAALERHEEAAGGDATRKELAALKRRAEALVEAIDDLHKPAIDALNYRTAVLRQGLRILVIAAEFADIPDQGVNLGAGRKAQPARIADYVAAQYFALTGKEPIVSVKHEKTAGIANHHKSYGPFLDLIKEVFDILSVDASPVSQATAAYQRFKAKSREKMRT
jgi:hypothetical protein